MFLFDHIHALIEMFNTYAKDYPFVAATISAWLLGVSSYICRNIPVNIYRFILKHSVTKLTMISTSEIYHNFLRWYMMNGYSNKCRSLKFSNGRWGRSDAVKSIGYGKQMFWMKGIPVFIELEKEDTKSEQEQDKITLTIPGRSHKLFNYLFKEINKDITLIDELVIYKYNDWWERIENQRKRSLDSVCIKDDIKETIVKHIENFKARKDWYLEKGIPYQTGILFYGPPGTGKTSIIKALASEFNMPLYILSTGEMDKAEKAFTKLPLNSIIVIEDIDTSLVVKSREPSEPEKQNQKDDLLNLISTDTLGDLLNAVDGICANEGRILFITTNHPEKIDPALLRPGRIDLKVNLDYADEEVLNKFINKFYDRDIPDDYVIKEKVSPADIQQLILDNLDDYQVILDRLRK